MPNCGTQCILCDLPIRFDTYKGCSHGCRYCFTQRKININKIKKHESVESLRKFINFERKHEISWCDWKIPLHWGRSERSIPAN
jgi:DNA repair photolyase